jgi:UDP-2,4-diacetamido-2,4,6-trideoxy-beta-L-altropyranose hydrolase
MKIAFRVDSGFQIGTGHLMRCLALASYLKTRGHDCLFLCRPLSGNFSNLVKDKFQLIELDQPSGLLNKILSPHGQWLQHDWKSDAEETLLKVMQLKCNYLIVDNYALDANWERILHKKVEKLVVIDDLADREHFCDILIDMNFSIENKYDKLTPDFTQKLIGLDYAIIRDEFLTFKEKRKRTQLKNILIFFGGSDDQNFAKKFVRTKIMDKFPQISFNLLTRNKELEVFENEFSNLIVHVAPSSVGELMNEADLFIGSGGTITFERFYMGLPGLIQCVSSNQVISNRELFKIGYNIEIDFIDHPSFLIDKLMEYNYNPDWIKNNSFVLQNLIDGKGFERIFTKIFDHIDDGFK